MPPPPELARDAPVLDVVEPVEPLLLEPDGHDIASHCIALRYSAVLCQFDPSFSLLLQPRSDGDDDVVADRLGGTRGAGRHARRIAPLNRRRDDGTTVGSERQEKQQRLNDEERGRIEGE